MKKEERLNTEREGGTDRAEVNSVNSDHEAVRTEVAIMNDGRMGKKEELLAVRWDESADGSKTSGSERCSAKRAGTRDRDGI